MGLGQLQLLSYGTENTFFNSNSNITYFKRTYKKYTNISFEVLPQYFRSTPNFGRRLSTKISKNSDMIKDITIYLELPDIPIEQHSSLPRGVKKFSWIDKIGFGIIRYIDLEIGGILVSRLYGDWLNIIYELSKRHIEGWDNNVGKDVKILTDYTNGKKSYKLYSYKI
jgi:hypothetical protein